MMKTSNNTLSVFLNKQHVGFLNKLPGQRMFFNFSEEYLHLQQRPTLSQSFFDNQSNLISETKTTQTRAPEFFSNLLPEGYLRQYLSEINNINSEREFQLLSILGEDLPGAIIIKDGDLEINSVNTNAADKSKKSSEEHLKFSLAGVQLKFSATFNKDLLTIPANGAGGNWIIKLSSQRFTRVPENEFSMLSLAKSIGIEVPEFKMIPSNHIRGLPKDIINPEENVFAIKRFDRAHAHRVHIEDFAQVYNLYPHLKYQKVSYSNMAKMIYDTIGDNALKEFIKRLTFNILIGNSDMHLKNWSLIYRDGVTPELSPAYDFVSTINYLKDNDMALSIVGEKNMHKVDLKLFEKMANKANLPSAFIKSTVIETVNKTIKSWRELKTSFPLTKESLNTIEKHMLSLPLSLDS